MQTTQSPLANFQETDNICLSICCIKQCTILSINDTSTCYSMTTCKLFMATCKLFMATCKLFMAMAESLTGCTCTGGNFPGYSEC